MKTILVLTDFSGKATHAAEYAFRMAEDLKASILLYNTFYVPQAFVAESGVLENEEEFNSYRLQSLEKLRLLAASLEQKFRRTHEQLIPRVSYQAGAGTFAENLQEIQKTKDIIMIVMGDHSVEGVFQHLVFGSETSFTLKHAKIPVLVVPETVRFHFFKKIALALDSLDRPAEDAMNFIIEHLAEPYHAEVVIIHVSPLNGDDEESERLLRNFNKFYDTINYDNVTFQNISENNVAKSVMHYAQISDIGMIVLISRHRAFYEQLVHKNTIKELMNYKSFPVLVMPGQS